MYVPSHLTMETQFSFRNFVYLKYTLDNGQCLTKYLYDLASFINILFLAFPFVHISFPFSFVLHLKVWTCKVSLTNNAICQTKSNFIHCECITYTHTINHIPSRILYHTHLWELIVQMFPIYILTKWRRSVTYYEPGRGFSSADFKPPNYSSIYLGAKR
jgi:hypothetical protein